MLLYNPAVKLTCFSLCFVVLAPVIVTDLAHVAKVTSTIGASPVTVVTVTTVPSSVTTVQTMPLLPTVLSHSVAQASAAIPTFPPVMVPPFRVPLPGMHIPLPGKEPQILLRGEIMSYFWPARQPTGSPPDGLATKLGWTQCSNV